MNRALISPGKYIQGAGAILEIGTHAAKLGSRAIVCGGRTALSMCGPDVMVCLEENGISCVQEIFGGVSSRKEVSRLKSLAANDQADLIITVGGGMAIDAGKVVADELDLPVIVVPTIATTNAPCSALSVIYTDAGELVEYLPLDRNPDCVLVDTRFIAQSPTRFLVAGMGDALATFWEADTCVRSGLANGVTGATGPTLSALALARLTYETLLKSGKQALFAVEKNVVTPAVEEIVEVTTLTSGLGFENLGHAGAHSIHNGLLTAKSTERKMHGEIVAFGVLVQLVLEGRPSGEITEVLDFCAGVGLPICLEDLGITNPSREEIHSVALTACAEGESVHSTWFPVTATDVDAAIWTADAQGHHHKNNR